METDPQQIEELKQLVRQSITLGEENNKILHGMRRNARIKNIFWFLVVVLSFGSSVWGVYYYIIPRLQQAEGLYQNAQSAIGQIQTLQQKVQGYFANPSTTTSSH